MTEAANWYPLEGYRWHRALVELRCTDCGRKVGRLYATDKGWRLEVVVQYRTPTVREIVGETDTEFARRLVAAALREPGPPRHDRRYVHRELVPPDEWLPRDVTWCTRCGVRTIDTQALRVKGEQAERTRRCATLGSPPLAQR